MKRIVVCMMIVVLALAACAPKPQVEAPAATMAPTEAASTPVATQEVMDEPAPTGPTLTVTDGTTEKLYTVDDLKAMGAEQATWRDVTYVGVKLSDLLKDAGFDPAALKAVKASASDGFSANYEPSQITAADTLVAYETAAGPFTKDDGAFRMVLPAEGGSANVRMLVKLTVI
jgi:hypothetical protein